MTRQIQEALFEFSAVRWLLAVTFLCRGLMRRRQGLLYRALVDFCWIERVSGAEPLRRIARRMIFESVETSKRTRRNQIVESFRNDPASATLSASYSLTGKGGPHDLWRDVIVLKKATATEKGVILLKYVRTFYAVVAMFDLERLMERYTFVLEPCWAGYCDPSVLMFIASGQPVVIQCFTEDDYQFVASVGAPLVPIRMGPASWVDQRLFAPRAGASKAYDLVMVANWGRHKRHATLFEALKAIRDRKIRVLLIGFPWAGRTATDIRREAASIGNPQVDVEVIESVPAAEVANYVSQCRVFVFLSRKEGDNKALVEAMFADVPAIVYDRTIGGAGGRINAQTGILSSDEDLAAKICYMLDHTTQFSPRAWAREHAGSIIATRQLNDALKRAVTDSGGRYVEAIVEKTNAPNLAYADHSSRARLQPDYDEILRHQLGRPAKGNAAVA